MTEMVRIGPGPQQVTACGVPPRRGPAIGQEELVALARPPLLALVRAYPWCRIGEPRIGEFFEEKVAARCVRVVRVQVPHYKAAEPSKPLPASG